MGRARQPMRICRPCADIRTRMSILYDILLGNLIVWEGSLCAAAGRAPSAQCSCLLAASHNSPRRGAVLRGRRCTLPWAARQRGYRRRAGQRAQLWPRLRASAPRVQRRPRRRARARVRRAAAERERGRQRHGDVEEAGLLVRAVPAKAQAGAPLAAAVRQRASHIRVVEQVPHCQRGASAAATGRRRRCRACASALVVGPLAVALLRRLVRSCAWQVPCSGYALPGRRSLLACPRTVLSAPARKYATRAQELAALKCAAQLPTAQCA